jgi:hypothetical protein
MEDNSKNLDFLKIAKQIDSKRSEQIKETKTRIIPLLLGSYDEVSLNEMKEIKEFLKNNGYTNTILLQDIQTKKGFENEYDKKYELLLSVLSEKDYFVIPLFNFPPKKRKNQGLGHHAELLDLLMKKNSFLVLQSGIFHYKYSNMLNHARMIINHFQIEDEDGHKNKILNFVERFYPFAEKTIKEYKNIYTNKTNRQRGDSFDK